MSTKTQIPIQQISCCPPLAEPPLAEADAEVLAGQFKALSNPSRLRLLSMVASLGDVCACDLVDTLGLSQPTISHHLKVLREAGLLESERRGRWIHYRPIREEIAALKAAL